MQPTTVIFEDAIHEAVLKKILHDNEEINWINSNGKTKIDSRMSDYLRASEHQNVIVIRDLDLDADCPPEFLSRRGLLDTSSSFVYRLAVREVETWLLADKINFCNHFRCGYSILMRVKVEKLRKPKDFVLRAIHNSRIPVERKKKIVSKVKTKYERRWNYNNEMLAFIEESWDINAASQNSESLSRAIIAINALRLN